MSKPFHFRRFSMMHHRSTMKVGTDAVMLGAWAEVEKAGHILDAGTGSGILALMAAQRNLLSTIHAIDVDAESVKEAAVNFGRSPWSNRLCARQADLRSYTPELKLSYDLILSNPPFFENHIKTSDARRNLARHTDSLSFADLLGACSRLLSAKGRASMVLPWEAGRQIIQFAPSYGLWPSRILNIIPVEGREPNRMNLELNKLPGASLCESNFVIRNTSMQFTHEYRELLKDFYLGFGD